jgi:uncharacterized protein YuzE
MALELVERYLKIISAVQSAPQKYLWSSYDAEADVLYINFKKPSHATDSELSEDDVIIRHEGKDIVGLTILHASKR